MPEEEQFFPIIGKKTGVLAFSKKKWLPSGEGQPSKGDF